MNCEIPFEVDDYNNIMSKDYIKKHNLMPICNNELFDNELSEVELNPIRNSIKNCPSCNVLIQTYPGCGATKCLMCKHKFNFNRDAKYDGRQPIDYTIINNRNNFNYVISTILGFIWLHMLSYLLYKYKNEIISGLLELKDIIYMFIPVFLQIVFVISFVIIPIIVHEINH
jgi:hypothetical protein